MKKTVVTISILLSGLSFAFAQSVNVPPLKPSNITINAPLASATSSTNRIPFTITWQDNASNESSYVVSILSATGTLFDPLATVYLPANATSARIMAYPLSVPQYALITVMNAFGVATATSVILSPATSPSRPSNIIISASLASATSSANRIPFTITWQDNAVNESSYVVSILSATGTLFDPLATVYLPANATSARIMAYPLSVPQYALITVMNAFGVATATSAILPGINIPSPKILFFGISASSSVIASTTDTVFNTFLYYSGDVTNTTLLFDTDKSTSTGHRIIGADYMIGISKAGAFLYKYDTSPSASSVYPWLKVTSLKYVISPNLITMSVRSSDMANAKSFYVTGWIQNAVTSKYTYITKFLWNKL